MPIRQTLHAIASNLWWTWTPDAQALFARIDPQLWERSNHAPLAVLNAASDARLREAFATAESMDELDGVAAALHRYLGADDSWTEREHPDLRHGTIAYFCAEFGLHESVPLYSGGLGVLAGDHLKTASDLGIPLVAVGLRYSEGYFRQSVDDHGYQREAYPRTDWRNFPATPVMNGEGPLELHVPIADRHVRVRAWRVDVGRVPLYLLDTDLDGNSEHDRSLSHRLYGGDIHTRIDQEVILGIGGVRLLTALGIEPTLLHLNEGHCAFACLERMRMWIQAGSSPDDALARVRSQTLFTTHTPVPAGHDRFGADLVAHRLGWIAPGLHRDVHGLIALGRVNADDHAEPFCMTVLSLRCAERANGVSALHGAVSREMWNHLWPDRPVDEVPIGHVTNGIHVETFLHPLMRAAVETHIGADWNALLVDPAAWAERADALPNDVFVGLRRALKRDMIDTLRHRLDMFRDQLGPDVEWTREALSWWNPETLTIGFARRFATYKRGAMLFGAMERAVELIASIDRPVQFVFAGKAHPRDEPGKAVIRQVIAAARDERLRGRVLFIENYDMGVARALISGADVWLNTPRRPHEASGTSGQKVAIHGGVNASILDGWWAEGYHGDNGFAIGDDRIPASVEEHDRRDAEALIATLSQQVIPEYYGSEQGTQGAWLARARAAFRTLPAEFSTRRMLRDYVERFYHVAG